MNSRLFRAPDIGAPALASPISDPDALVSADLSAEKNSLPVSTTSRLGTAGNPLPLWKRALDVAGCLLALPFLGLCTLFMLVLIKCYSPGPVFYRQERIGYMGRRFKIYKFRTMRAGADCRVHQNYCKDLIRSNAPLVKLDSRGDSRLIPFAWLIRACGLDELPQIINVLRGEMSLVGPRPCIPAEFEQFVSRQRQRCDVLPGLTGLWQVSGKNRTTFEEMIRLDLEYIQELSLWLDVKIMLATPAALWTQYGETRLARKSQRRVDHAEPAVSPATSHAAASAPQTILGPTVPSASSGTPF